MPKNNKSIVLYACMFALAAEKAERCAAQDSETERQLRELRQQNQALQEQLRQQQLQIESLTRRVTEIQNADSRRNEALNNQPSEDRQSGQPQSMRPLNLSKINISGEGGVAFFETGNEGMSPHAEFRVDEARLFLEAPVWGDVYFFSELNLITREASDLSLQLGELYLDVENVSQLWNRDRMLNLRIGRMYTPFGEEYQVRYAIDNPLISHSLS